MNTAAKYRLLRALAEAARAQLLMVERVAAELHDPGAIEDACIAEIAALHLVDRAAQALDDDEEPDELQELAREEAAGG